MDHQDLNHMDEEQVFKWFSNPKSPMFYHNYQEYFGTMHSFAYLFDDQVIYISFPMEILTRLTGVIGLRGTI